MESAKRELKKIKNQLEENQVLHSNEKSDLVQGLELKNSNLEKDVAKLKSILDVSIAIRPGKSGLKKNVLNTF